MIHVEHPVPSAFESEARVEAEAGLAFQITSKIEVNNKNLIEGQVV